MIDNNKDLGWNDSGGQSLKPKPIDIMEEVKEQRLQKTIIDTKVNHKDLDYKDL